MALLWIYLYIADDKMECKRKTNVECVEIVYAGLSWIQKKNI